MISSEGPRIALVAGALAAWLTGCGSEVSGPVRPGDCSELALGVTPNSLAVGGAALLVSDSSASGLTWSVTEPTVARVDPDEPTLEALDTGSTYVRVTDDRARSCSVGVSVRPGNVVDRTRSLDVPFGPMYPMFSAREPGKIEVLQTGPPVFPEIDDGIPGPIEIATIDVETGVMSDARIPPSQIPFAVLADLSFRGIIDEDFRDWDLAEFQATPTGYLAAFAPTSFDNPARGILGPLGVLALFLDSQGRSAVLTPLEPLEGAADACSVFAGAALLDELLYLAVSRFELAAPGECGALDRVEIHAGPPPAGPLEVILSIPAEELSGFAVAEQRRPLTDTVSGTVVGLSSQLRTPQLEPATLSDGRSLLAFQDRSTARAVLIDPSERRLWGRIDLSDAVVPADYDARNFVWGPAGEFWLITTVENETVEAPESRPVPPADYDLASLTPIPSSGGSGTTSVTGGFDVTLTAVDDLLRSNLRLRLPPGLAERGGTLVLEGMDERPSYSSTEESVAKVDPDGNVALGHAGFAEVRVTAPRGDSFSVPLEVRELLPLGPADPRVELPDGALVAVSPVGEAEAVALVERIAPEDPCEPAELAVQHVVGGIARREIPVPALEAPATPGPGGPDVEEWFTGEDVALDAQTGTYWIGGARTSCGTGDDGAPVSHHRPTLLRVDVAGRLLEELLLEPVLGIAPPETSLAPSVQVDPRPDGTLIVGVNAEVAVLDGSGLSAALYEQPSFDERTWSLDEIRALAGDELLIVLSKGAVSRRGLAALGNSPERDVQIVRIDRDGVATELDIARIEELVTGLERDGDNLRLLLAERSGAQARDLVLTGLASFGD